MNFGADGRKSFRSVSRPVPNGAKLARTSRLRTLISKDDNPPPNRSELACFIEVYMSKDGQLRSVKLVTADSTLDNTGKRTKHFKVVERPVCKFVLLVHGDDEDSGSIPAKEP